MNILITFMEDNISVATGKAEGTSYKSFKQEKWLELEKKLNAAGPPARDAKGWRKVWTDLIHETRKKVREAEVDRGTTGGGRARPVKLTDIQNRVRDLLDLSKAVQGNPGINFGFGGLQEKFDASQAGPSHAPADRSRAGPPEAGSSHAGPSHADPAHAGPSHSGPFQARENDPSVEYPTLDEDSCSSNAGIAVLNEAETMEVNGSHANKGKNLTNTKGSTLLKAYNERFESTLQFQKEQLSFIKETKKAFEYSFKELIDISKETQNICKMQFNLERERFCIEKKRLEIEEDTLKTFQNIHENLRNYFEK
ncbi:uncharacterized protein LOC129805001 [Phlebotomus papatasi]|uniref:uncharacterized protein LOC129805001 n=1 Tax=Phlebotomus papatasi TaxID=29031 RepID=UPI00248437DF|nr:uncharacterized protein LOC129805001 [Phlebotomus papatasi]